MKSPAVSIGLPFYNDAKYLPIAVKSIFAQTVRDWELILVDDGSTDASVEFARSLADPRVRVFVDGLHKNLNVRLNEAVKHSRGDYFARMDADDVMHPNRLERQIKVLSEHGQNTVVGTTCYSINTQSHVVGHRRGQLSQREGFGARHSFIHPTVIANREWFLANPYSEDFVFHRSQDAELWCRTTKTSKFIVLNEPLLFVREVGVFSFQKELGTRLGILSLAHQYSRTWSECIFLLSREIAKLWFISVMYVSGHAEIARRRYRSLQIQDREAGEAALDQVNSVMLPVRIEDCIVTVNA